MTLRWFFGDTDDDDTHYAQAILDAMQAGIALVPAIWGLEVANVIARAESQGVVPEARSGTFLELLHALAIEVDGRTHQHAFSDTLHLARRYRLSAYDAAYLELALRTGLPLATLDRDLRGAAGKAGIDVMTF